MTDTIYLRREDGTTIRLTQTPYDSEDLFQRLLTETQDLLAGEQIHPDTPRRWLLISREVGIADTENGTGRWSLDHLFLDQDGVPTFVEVKRSTDTRIRREVVGQMLDYAANATVHWPVDYIQGQYEARCDQQGIDPVEQLTLFLEDDTSEERFWEAVNANLIAGRIRLLFVADSIPPELQRVIEFLNERMTPTEVLGVEIRKYIGEGLESYIPKVIGRTAEAQAVKSRTPRRKTRTWGYDSFFEVLREQNDAQTVRVVKQLFSWGQAHGMEPQWGSGYYDGSLALNQYRDGITYFTFQLWTSGDVVIPLNFMRGEGLFSSEDERRHLLERLNTVPGVVLPADSLNGKPSFKAKDLAPEGRIRAFLDVWDWYLSKIDAHRGAE